MKGSECSSMRSSEDMLVPSMKAVVSDDGLGINPLNSNHDPVKQNVANYSRSVNAQRLPDLHSCIHLALMLHCRLFTCAPLTASRLCTFSACMLIVDQSNPASRSGHTSPISPQPQTRIITLAGIWRHQAGCLSTAAPVGVWPIANLEQEASC